MRKLLTMMFAAVFVISIGATAFAAGPDEHVVTGEVLAIDSLGKTVVIRTETGEKTVVVESDTKGFEHLKPGMSVEMTCIDLKGRSCAKIIRPAEPMHSRIIEGEVLSIDPEGKTMLLKTPQGEEVSMEIKTGEAMMVSPAMGAASSEEMMKARTMPVEGIMPGAKVKVDCFDSGGKFCANKITVVSPEEAGKPVMGEVVSGRIVSIDSTNKSVVIDTTKGTRSLYYQKVTGGMPFGELEMGKKVRAYCLDIEGKSCIKDITEVE